MTHPQKVIYELTAPSAHIPIARYTILFMYALGKFNSKYAHLHIFIAQPFLLPDLFTEDEDPVVNSAGAKIQRCILYVGARV